MEGLHTLKSCLQKGHLMGKIDLKDAYFEDIYQVRRERKLASVPLFVFYASSSPKNFNETYEILNFSVVSNSDKNYCVSRQHAPVSSRSRGDFDGKRHSNFSLAEIGFHH